MDIYVIHTDKIFIIFKRNNLAERLRNAEGNGDGGALFSNIGFDSLTDKFFSLLQKGAFYSSEFWGKSLEEKPGSQKTFELEIK